ncbi:hypothetical protein ACJ41O_010724 [Fusarium nematophilum]
MRSFKYLAILLLADMGVLASPVSDADLAKMVERGEIKPEEDVTELDRRDCAGCGLYLCAGKNFSGKCYWGCYPPRKTVTIDKWWQTRIQSVGPDKGCVCTIGTPYVYPPSAGDASRVNQFNSSHSSCQAFTHPGGNVGNNACRANVGNFFCVPT